MEQQKLSAVNPLMQPEAALEFLTTLFLPDDIVTFRPIETWSEQGKRRSRVDYRNVLHRGANQDLLQLTIKQLFESSAGERTNLFFGVCPRFGPNGQYDLAWQIRTVRALWTDIDHVTVDEARQGLAKAGLPVPSILVNSGNGVHLYWLLSEPYRIDDVGDPPPILTEWVETIGGKKKPHRHLIEDGERIEIDRRQHISRLSAKAASLQDLLAGIAQACGGDHTTDLCRLLRVPGSLNRKDQRIGREPAQTQLVECVGSRRYAIADFARFQVTAPETDRFRKILAVPLPQLRKLTAKKEDRLTELITGCSIASAGHRSEADFRLCCFAIQNGIDKGTVWSKVADVGKFAERGEAYFELTWENAAFESRAKLYDKVAGEELARSLTTPSGSPPQPGEDDGDADEPTTITIDSAETPTREIMRKITDRLQQTEIAFLRCDQLVVVRADTISAILTSPELAGLLNEFVEFRFITKTGTDYRPLTAEYGNTWLHHHAEQQRLPKIQLFTRHPVFTDDWRLSAPGYDRQTGIYYAGGKVTAKTDNPLLNQLLQDFCFKSPADRTNYLALLMTSLLIPRFIGAKPAVLFNGNQPGLGKSILAQIIAILRDGAPTETASFNHNDEEFEKRLGAIVRRGTTTIIIDNAKGQGRKQRIESACLERSITDPILSYRLLGKSQEIRAENCHQFCITANTPDVSPDLVSRSVVVNLEYEGDPKHRKFHLPDPEEFAIRHRLELQGELIGMVQRWIEAGRPEAQVATRFNKRGWGNMIGGILQVNGEPDFLANAEVAAMQLDDTRREFTELAGILREHPKGTWTAAELVDLCRHEGLLAAELGDGSTRALATKFGTLAGRFVNERLGTETDAEVVFQRTQERKGNVYRVVYVEKVPNLRAFAEPLPNLDSTIGSAP